MENEKRAEPLPIDVNCNEFYNQLQDEIETDLAQLKKNVEILRDIRSKYLPTFVSIL